MARFNDGPGWCSDEKRKTLEGLLSVSCEAKELYLSPVHVILTLYNIVFNIVDCAKSMVY